MQEVKNIIPPRQLNQNEQSILNQLLSQPFSGRDALLKQLEIVLVSGECTCGCPSFILYVDYSKVPKAEVKRRIPIEAEGTDADGIIIHYLLHVVDGYLNELEIYREDLGKIIRLPTATSLNLICLDEP